MVSADTGVTALDPLVFGERCFDLSSNACIVKILPGGVRRCVGCVSARMAQQRS